MFKSAETGLNLDTSSIEGAEEGFARVKLVVPP